MRHNIIAREGEEYFCENGHDYQNFLDVNRNWRCPICNEYVAIKVQINGFLHSCHRVEANNLQIGDLVTLDNDYIREILNIAVSDGKYRIALKEYRVIELPSESIITRIDGGWYR